MAGKTIVQWQNSYSVGIKLVDDQHQELIKLTNKLFINCMAGREQSRTAFMDTIREAIDYVGYHFSTEEKIMERVNYPDTAAHIKEHKEFVKQVLIKVDDFKAGRITAPLSFVYFLRDWILHHVAVNDKKMGDYLIVLKKSGDLHQMTVKVKKDEATNRVHIQ